MASEAFIVGQEWISEHYFTTDAKSQSFQAELVKLRKEWDDLAKDAIATPKSRFTAIRGELSGAFAALGEGLTPAELRRRIYAPITGALGYDAPSLQRQTSGPLTLIAPNGQIEGSAVALIEARAVEAVDALLARDDSTLLEPYVPVDDENHPIWSAARLLSTLFIADDGPQFAIVLAGRWALLAEKERWPEGRYLAVDLQLVADRNHTAKAGELDRAVACLCADSLVPAADGTVWWQTILDQAIKHTVGVSQDLREGVRQSIEIIANEVVARRDEMCLAPLPADQAQPLAKQSLRYLYRILFLLFAEASPELDVLPANVGEYEEGYSLDRLRELVQVELSHDAASRTHLYDSLATLFRLVDDGNPTPTHGDDTALDDDTVHVDDAEHLPEGLTFNSLKADLFLPEAISLIAETGLGDAAMQQVLAHLLLSKERKGSDRGFISYANLGINQLGAVYEGLMSYTGFFAETDLYEVAKGGDSSKGSWVVPVDRATGIDGADFVQAIDPISGESKAVLHEAGSFVFRLAGRERQQSASYYTPEVLTKFVVSQALAELLDQDGTITSAADILTMRVCEPALGSGAFAIEAVRQLAEEYLSRRMRELADSDDPDDSLDPDQYPIELQKVKASIALHQVYGVDLNATAVELAEISLWLDTMVSGLDAPWFGLHLKRGNSLIGARRAVYTPAQVTSKAWLKDTPRNVPLTELADNIEAGRISGETSGSIHHFLLPAEGWGSAVDAKEAKALAPDELAALKRWRAQFKTKPSKAQLARLVNLSYRVERLWQFALCRLQAAEDGSRRAIPIWGRDAEPQFAGGSAVSRDEIERKLRDPDGAFQRLRMGMDAWNAMWFWPLTNTVIGDTMPPTLDEWIAGLAAVLGTHIEGKKKTAEGQSGFDLDTNWERLGAAEEFDKSLAGVQPIDQVLAEHPWLVAARRISEQQGFFHWELDFATVFAAGGFDLQVGNPPWVRPDFDEAASLAEFDPWWALTVKPSIADTEERRQDTLKRPNAPSSYLNDLVSVIATRSAVSHRSRFPLLHGLRPDLYRCFMEQTWLNSSPRGTTGLIHPESHFTDEKAGPLRSEAYSRLRRHWQFANELKLFEVGNRKDFGVYIYAAPSNVGFKQATSLYHPATIERSYLHDGSGEQPGLKDPEGHWDMRPHRGRIITVDDETLRTWHAVLEDGTVPVRQTRMVYAVNQATAAVLDKLALAPRLGELGLEFSQGWNETTDFNKGYFTKSWGSVDSWDDVILQGPHIFVANPFYQYPNKTMSSHRDWSAVDLETLAPDALPITSYKPAGDPVRYNAAYTRWGPDKLPARDFYRVAWRNMTDNVGERSLIPAIIPPGAAQIHGITALGFPDLEGHKLAAVAGVMSSLIVDMSIRIAPKGTISAKTVQRLPAASDGSLMGPLVLRSARLNSVTEAFGNFWTDCYRTDFESDAWAGGLEFAGRQSISRIDHEWTHDVPLRRASDRRQALIEIDAIVALTLGLTADELCTIYRTQFAVLYGYDRNSYFYDINGRLVPKSVLTTWRTKGDRITEAERTATNPAGNTYTYELPFVTLDREADMRQAYAHFERILAERS